MRSKKCVSAASSQQPPLLFSITTIIFILIASPSTSYGEEDEQFFNCSTPFRCGEYNQEIKYPFWGGNRSQDCGLPGFELRCQQNSYLTIDTASQTLRVLSIDESSSSFTVARNDLWDGICPEKYQSTDLTHDPTFRYGQGVQMIIFFYFCPPLAFDFPVRNNYTCDINGNKSTGFFVDPAFHSVQLPFPTEECALNITVPVLGSALAEFSSNTSVTIQELLHQGFRLEYDAKRTACSACTSSGGVCWSRTNSEIPMCLCRDGAHEYICPGGGFNVGLKIGIGAIVAGIVLSACFFIWYCKYKECLDGSILPCYRRRTIDDQNLEAVIKQYGSLTPRRYSYSDIKKMTNSFRDKLGQGGYGDVYKGYLSNSLPVAVKILKTTKGNGEEFINEVASISKTAHVNIVTLLGFCLDGRKKALIYEFLSNGSLEKYIRKESDDQLGLERLYEISLGIARGLEYLHRGCNTRILHFDIKPQNILLDEDFCPKISDFGLAKPCARKESIVSMLGARGTVGYIAPEVFSRSFGGVSYKSDVYSYGMMVLETVGGRRDATNVEMSNGHEAYFPHWIYQRVMLDEDLKLKDRVMTKEEDEIARKMIIVGLWCIQIHPSQRPSMSKVIDMLEASLEDLELPPKHFLCSSSSPEDVSVSTALLSSYKSSVADSFTRSP